MVGATIDSKGTEMPSKVKFVIGMLAFTVVLRLLPYFLTTYNVTLNPTVIYYPWHFMPMMAICLYSGAYLADRRWAVGLPLIGLFVSDLSIWAMTGNFSWAFQGDRWSAYVCYLLAAMMGAGLNRRSWPARGVDAFTRGVLAEVLFFVVTNFVYFCIQSDLPHSLAGLYTCYLNAIPFAGQAFLSTAFYSVLVFSPLVVRTKEMALAGKPELQSSMAR